MAVSDSAKEFNKFKKDLGIFGFKDTEETLYQDIQEWLTQKVNEVREELRILKIKKSTENQKYLSEAQQKFALNMNTQDYQVKHVFHRNNGEFSGVASYNDNQKKLILSFAGSKSLTDWVKNLTGWNGHASADLGALTGISFHSGFISHLNDNAPAFSAFIHSWLQDFKTKNPGESLEIIGTGHSLGGALAEIFTAATKQIAESMGIKVKVGVMTFGAPNTVASTTVDKYTDIMGKGNIIRFSHSYDIVPKAVFWKANPGEALIKEDRSLFHDMNGTLSLPVRFNPHSSSDYYHAATTAFKQWKEHIKDLQNLILERASKEEKIEQINNEIESLKKEVMNDYKKLTKFDQDHFKVLGMQHEIRLEKEEEALKALKAKKESYKEAAKAAHAQGNSKELKKITTHAKELNAEISAQEKQLTFLKKDKAWKSQWAEFQAHEKKETDDIMKSLLDDEIMASVA